MRTPLLSMSLLWLVVSTARADDRDAAYLRGQLDELPKQLPTIVAEPGRAKATAQQPPWCDLVKTGVGRPRPSSISRSMSSGNWLAAAELACEWPNEPAIHQTVQLVMQRWINITGLSASEALESWRARMKPDRMKADKEALCDQLIVPAEVDGETKVFMQTRRALFGCVQKGYMDQPPLWDAPGAKLPDDLITYLDLSASPADELVRLAWVVHRSRAALGKLDDRMLPGYVVDQVDYQALSPQKVRALLATTPYRGNAYARTILLETLARAQLSVAAFDAAVKQRASDADWKELLVTAPQRGIADWTAKAQQHAQLIARSNDFENKFFGPSRKAIKGCWPELRKDYIAVLQTLKRGTVNELKEAMSDPIASLMLARLAACAAIDLDKQYATDLIQLAKSVRYARGPRLAAYYAAIDALSKILADRTKFPIGAKDFYFRLGSPLLGDALVLINNNSQYFSERGQKGVVKAVKKAGDKLQITWVTVKHQEMGVSCTDTNRIMDFSANGQPMYWRNCVSTGMVTVDDTPNGITVPVELADGITVGAAIEFDGDPAVSNTRPGMPTAVYKDKTKKKLVSAYGFPL